MRRTRIFLFAFLILGGVLVVFVGARIYMRAIPTPVHPQPGSAPSFAQSQPPLQWSATVERARQMVQARLAEQNMPGLSVAVGVGGDIVWAEGFGWADVATRAPVTPATQFRIGTASTLLTSAAAGVLLEKGQLKLDDDIHTYVPQFPKKRWPITVRQLMGHMAGVGTDGGDEGPLLSQRCERPVDALQHFAADELSFEPGTQYRHSKYGWILVSAAIEAAANRPFLAFMREQIFQPLGMTGTGAESATEENPDHVGEASEDMPLLTLVQEEILEPIGIGPKAGAADEKISDRATFYVPRTGGDPRNGMHVMRPHNLSCYAGSMAFLSTASDLVRFVLAINSGKLLPPATVQSFQTSQQLRSGQETGYGLGWDLEAVTVAGEPAQAVGHDGELFGGRVMTLMTLPQRGIVIVVMSNIAHGNTSDLALKIAEAFAGK